MIDVNELLENAISEVDNLSYNETFLIKELFKGYEWNRIPRNSRLLLGTLFLNYVNSESHEVKAIDKTSSGQQKYIKINKKKHEEL